jgi:broad specificity phosphatase PhoE
MLVLAVTHSDSAARSPRSLSEGGRQQALWAARRLREFVGKKAVLVAALSSPKTRCLETAILVAREFGETTKSETTSFDRIDVRRELEEAKDPMTPEALKQLLDGVTQDIEIAQHITSDAAVLISMHGDLANALRESVTLAPHLAPDGWFDVRPVIAVCDFVESRLSVKSCRVLQAGSWTDCLATQKETPA